MNISWGLAFWQVVNFAILIGFILLIIRLVKNSNTIVKSLNDLKKEIESLSGKVDSILKK
jgi:uncharacterized protein YoxC